MLDKELIRLLRAEDPKHWTYRSLGIRFNVSPQRIYQICHPASQQAHYRREVQRKRQADVVAAVNKRLANGQKPTISQYIRWLRECGRDKEFAEYTQDWAKEAFKW